MELAARTLGPETNLGLPMLLRIPRGLCTKHRIFGTANRWNGCHGCVTISTHGRVAVVSGASHGIGTTMAKAREGDLTRKTPGARRFVAIPVRRIGSGR